MTCIVDPEVFPTKKSLREAVARCPGAVYIEDPSIFAGSRSCFTAADIKVGESLVVTNHPKRSWFASIRRTGEESYRVE
jgi:hypothetical protein